MYVVMHAHLNFKFQLALHSEIDQAIRLFIFKIESQHQFYYSLWFLLCMFSKFLCIFSSITVCMYCTSCHNVSL